MDKKLLCRNSYFRLAFSRVMVLAVVLALFGCASSKVKLTKTYDGPSLSRQEVSVIVPVVRKPVQNLTTGQKVIRLFAAWIEYDDLFISQIDGNDVVSTSPYSYYEILPGMHDIKFSIQRESSTGKNKRKKVTFTTIPIRDSLKMDFKPGHIYLVDFIQKKGTAGDFSLVVKDVTNDPEYEDVMSSD